MWLNVVFHISLAVFLHNYELKRSRWLSVSRIHSLTCPLPVEMSRTETSLTFLLFAAANFSSVMVKVNAVCSLLMFVRFLVVFLFPHTSFFSPSYQVVPSKVHTANMPSVLFLVDMNCWLLFSLTLWRNLFTEYSVKLVSWDICFPT